MENVEIEIQVKIENSQPLVEFLNKNGEFKYEDHQIDEYYSPAHRNFLDAHPVEEWLRLRDSNGKYSVTYKKWHYENGRGTHCDEYELSIENIGQMQKIFQVLNFKKITVVDKVRKAWNYKDYEVAMDLVKGLGEFVEVEYKGDKTNAEPKQIAAEMAQFLKEGRTHVTHMHFHILPREPDDDLQKTEGGRTAMYLDFSPEEKEKMMNLLK